MSNNDEIKTSLTKFFIKAIPWAIVYGIGVVTGIFIGVK